MAMRLFILIWRHYVSLISIYNRYRYRQLTRGVSNVKEAAPAADAADTASSHNERI